MHILEHRQSSAKLNPEEFEEDYSGKWCQAWVIVQVWVTKFLKIKLILLRHTTEWSEKLWKLNLLQGTFLILGAVRFYNQWTRWDKEENQPLEKRTCTPVLLLVYLFVLWALCFLSLPARSALGTPLCSPKLCSWLVPQLFCVFILLHTKWIP